MDLFNDEELKLLKRKRHSISLKSVFMNELSEFDENISQLTDGYSKEIYSRPSLEKAYNSTYIDQNNTIIN